jgi:hypothetical protein
MSRTNADDLATLTGQPTRPAIIANRHGLYGPDHLSDAARSLRESGGTEGGALINKQLAACSEIIDGTTKAISSLQGERRRLTPVGMMERRQAIGKAAFDTLRKESDNQQKAVARMVAETQAKLPTAPPRKVTDAKDVIAYHREAEIRSRLMAKPALDRFALLEAFAKAGAVEIVSAAIHDPMGEVVNDERAKQLVDLWNRATQPELFEAHEAVKEIESTFKANMRAVQKSLGQVIGVDEDEIAKAAGATQPELVAV